MPDIKVKPKNELKIRKFDATTVYTQKLKDNIVSINTKTNNTNNTNNENNSENDKELEVTSEDLELAKSLVNNFEIFMTLVKESKDS